MNSIYIYDGEFEKGDKGFPLIKAAAAAFGRENGLDFDFEQADIYRKPKGKPYFVHIPVEFSLTHSGQLWMCMFSDKPCGLDLQVVKECSFEGIADRQYTPEEQHYVELWGLEGFFDIWVRKEAFGKLTGEGIFSDMPSVVNHEADLYEKVLWNGRTFYFTDVEISPQLKCAVCAEVKEELEMRVLG